MSYNYSSSTNGLPNIIMRGKYRYENSILLHDSKPGQSNTESQVIANGFLWSFWRWSSGFPTFYWICYRITPTRLPKKKIEKMNIQPFPNVQGSILFPSPPFLMPEIGLQRTNNRSLWEKIQTESLDIYTLYYLKDVTHPPPNFLWPSPKKIYIYILWT